MTMITVKEGDLLRYYGERDRGDKVLWFGIILSITKEEITTYSRWIDREHWFRTITKLSQTIEYIEKGHYELN